VVFPGDYRRYFAGQIKSITALKFNDLAIETIGFENNELASNTSVFQVV
jgi:hypothetical protein